jgi:polyadenylate-binding protein
MTTTTQNQNSTQAPANPTAPYSSASLYVGDLHQDVSEAVLFEVFNAIGPVASVRVCRDAATRRSLGYAYVNYHRPEDAEKAMASLNFSDIRGRACRIMWSHRDPSLRKSGQGNIFVKNLAKSIDNRTLYDTFQIFGPILSCKVATNHKGESLGYGFVHYENDESANKAIDKVDGKMIADQKVSVAAFKSKKDRGGESKNQYTNLYVKNIPAEFTKEKLEELFSKYGTITSCMVASDNEGKGKGFGFVNFQAPEEAAAAVESINNMEIPGNAGKKLYVGRAQKRDERERELRGRFEKLKLERQNKMQGVNLYVKNLGEDCDEKRLREEFSKFGSITSCRIMRDETKTKSKGFGFVSFSQPEEAQKAVLEMNQKLFEGKPLYVALAQRKDVRRQELEARRSGLPQGGPHMFANAPLFYGPAQRGGFMYGGPMAGAGGRGGWMGPMGQPGPSGGMNPQGMLAGMRGAPQPGMPYPFPGGMMQFAGRGGPSHGFAQGPRQPGVGGRGRGAGAPRTAGASPQAMQQPRRAQQMPGGMPGMVMQQPMGGPNVAAVAGQKIQYGDNVRNQVLRSPPTASNAENGPEPTLSSVKGPSITIKNLAAQPPAQQKQMIGEQLFTRIQTAEPGLAGKITGMLLEMDNGELIHLLESQELLSEKIQEAKEVLAQHEQQQSGAEAE